MADLDQLQPPRLPTEAQKLHSSSQEELLNAIDRLRDAHIDKDISIPQIIVCGDQSSGKSSVLEAIAAGGIRFPIGGDTVTRFATEVVLRRGPPCPVKIKLRPSASRLSDERALVEAFKPDFNLRRPEDFGSIIEAAAKHLKDVDKTANPLRGIWHDVLRVELSGPEQMHLTLVDLPGLVHTSVRAIKEGNNSTEDDLQDETHAIKTLVSEYLQRPRTVVLAVVSAVYDLKLQEVAAYLNALPEVRQRTLGIITKPDRLRPGSDDEKKIIKLVQGDGSHLKPLGHGWHVLRNLAHEETDRAAAHRDETERHFFGQDSWTQLEAQNTGIVNLRSKLSRHLFGCITSELAELRNELESELKHRNDYLEQVGEGRETFQQQQRYLSGVLSKLQRLTEAALEGHYDKREFAAFFDSSVGKRLRAIITNEAEQFSSDMRQRGCQFQIPGDYVEELDFDYLPLSASPNFWPPYTHPGADAKQKIYNIDLVTYCEALSEYMDDIRGNELLCLFPPKVVTAIFRQHSVPWESLARDYLDKCFNATLDFFDRAVTYGAGPETGAKLLERYILPALEEKRVRLAMKLEEILWPFRRGQPMTLSSFFDSRPLSRALLNSGEQDGAAEIPPRAARAKAQGFSPKSQSAALALDHAEAYYAVAENTFVDKCATLAVEACLLDGLTDLFGSGVVWELPAEEVTRIAQEEPEARKRRHDTKTQKAVLEDVIKILRKYARHGQDPDDVSWVNDQRAIVHSEQSGGPLNTPSILASRPKSSQATFRTAYDGTFVSTPGSASVLRDVDLSTQVSNGFFRIGSPAFARSAKRGRMTRSSKHTTSLAGRTTDQISKFTFGQGGNSTFTSSAGFGWFGAGTEADTNDERCGNYKRSRGRYSG